MPGATTLDRIIVAAVTLLLAAFAFGSISMLVSPALADDSVAKRDDGRAELVAGDDDDDDDTGTNGDNTGTNGGDTSNSNSKTGTTRGTGQSHSKSNTS